MAMSDVLPRLVIRHKTPCKECPWRKVAPRGYLGGHTVAAFVDPVRNGVPTPCHLHSTKPDTMCAGAAIIMRNSLTLPRDPHNAEQVDKVAKSEDVFQWVREFAEHHRVEFLSGKVKR